MKNILRLFILSVLLIFASTSCTTPDDRPLCERDNFGHVTVLNGTSFYIWVDVTNPSQTVSYGEVELAHGNSYLYVVTPGSLVIWAQSDYNHANGINSWNSSSETITQCDEFSFTWNSGKGEGTNFVDYKGGGKVKDQ